MSTEEKKTETTGSENSGEVLTRTELFIEKNQKKLTTALTIIILIIAGAYSIHKFYLAPREKEAQAEMFNAERVFASDSFRLALQGDGVSFLGFLDIIEEYSFTKASNLSKYYAGICYMKLGQYEEAIEMLSGFSLKSPLLNPICLGNIGDAYAELGELENAAKYYKKAIKASDNELTTPIFLIKAGKVNESLGNYAEALEMYKRIQSDYSKTMQARTIDKYITRAELLLNK